jgi:hypothetical protein
MSRGLFGLLASNSGYHQCNSRKHPSIDVCGKRRPDSVSPKSLPYHQPTRCNEYAQWACYEMSAAPMDTELLGFEIPGVVARWRQEAITARAVRTSQGSAGVIKSLAAVRRRYDELMTRAAAAPEATLGQRLYTARRRANLTAAGAAAAMGASADLITLWRARRRRPATPGRASRN